MNLKNNDTPQSVFLLTLLLVSLFASATQAHGGLTNPPARNTLVGSNWAYNGVDWNAGSSGTSSGFVGPWTDPGVTSVCGAPSWDTPGPVMANFTAGQVISIELAITAAHMGYHEFRLCPRSLAAKNDLADCLLNGYLLRRETPLPPGSMSLYVKGPTSWTTEQLATRWRAPSLNKASPSEFSSQDGKPTGRMFKGYPIYALNYVLPNIQCERCILNWFYQSTNSAVTDANTLDTVQGERFWNCADISISAANGANGTPDVGNNVNNSSPSSDLTPNNSSPSYDLTPGAQAAIAIVALVIVGALIGVFVLHKKKESEGF